MTENVGRCGRLLDEPGFELFELFDVLDRLRDAMKDN